MSSQRTAPSQAPAAKPAKRRRGEKTASDRATTLALPEASSLPPSSGATRAAERRQAILEAALGEFVARGFAATRLDDVAKRAGVAKGTLSLHFKVKAAVVQALVRT